MEPIEVFQILGIEQTKDERALKNAYRDKLTVTNPEDDPEGFKRLRMAYEEACRYAGTPDAEENEEAMTEGIQMVKTGQVTYAVRDTHIDEKEIHQGDIMGLGDHGLLAVGQDILTVAEETIRAMVDEESELISIYYGEDMSEEDAESLGEKIEQAYPDCDVEVNYGGQPIYYYIVSAE